MNPFFDPKLSKSAKEVQCDSNRCYILQSYNEGSSWKAYKIKDKVLIGGEKSPSIELFQNSVDFIFHCQESETGLFRSQYVDGIMGMAAREETIPFILYSNNITITKTFALCFREKGGLMTLGGVDMSIHKSPISYINFKVNAKGFFIVKLNDILLRNPNNNVTTSINVPSSILNDVKGVIIDSGTTDTYLPIKSKSNFVKLFYNISGIHYIAGLTTNKTKDILHTLPSLIYKFDGPNGVIDIERPSSTYIETTNDGFLAFRIYLKEPSGTVLGANFMNNLNIIFDIERELIGFAVSDCT